MQTLPAHLTAAAKASGWPKGLDALLAEIGEVTALISDAVRKGAIHGHLRGSANVQNVQGEEVQKLDEWANDILCKRLAACGLVRAIASEEEDEVMAADPNGAFLVAFDPLDGSSNIDVNATIGTIFGIYHRPAPASADFLFSGAQQVAAGYTTYGSSTMFVYTARSGVHGFTLDPETDQYVQTHADIQCPVEGAIYSANEGNKSTWAPAQQRLVAGYQEADKATRRPYSARYIGSLVADFHRTLLKGGIFIYPADAKNARGKLRYLYEAAPLSLVCEEAGGAGSDGERRMLDLTAAKLHERVPLYIGSKAMVEEAVGALAKG